MIKNLRKGDKNLNIEGRNLSFSFQAIADDLTGACDLASHLIGKDIAEKVEIFTQVPDLYQEKNSSKTPKKCAFSVINTGTREKKPAQVGPIIEKACELVRESKALHFKKIDSTLRGPFLQELPHWLRVLGLKNCALIPAYPSLGRKLINDHYFIFEKPLGETEFADKALFNHSLPLSQEISRLTGLKCEYIDISKGHSQNIEDIKEHMRNEIQVLLFSGEEDQDIEKAVRICAQLEINAICGSSSSVNFLKHFEKIQLISQTNIPPLKDEKSVISHSTTSLSHAPHQCLFKGENPNTIYPQPKRILVLCSSYNQVSQKQIEKAKSDGAVHLTVPILAGINDLKPDFMKKILKKAIYSINSQNDYCLILSTPHKNINPDTSISHALAKIGNMILKELKSKKMTPEIIMLFGGETALSFLLEKKISSFFVIKSIFTGISLTERCDNSHLLIKPGGFGEIDLITKIRQMPLQ